MRLSEAISDQFGAAAPGLVLDSRLCRTSPSMAHEILAVSPDEVSENPFSAPCSPQIMDEELTKIGSAEQWANTWGSKCGCSQIIIDTVAMMVNVGTQHWGFYPRMEKVLLHWPRATPATWWLMLETDNDVHAVLFDKLKTCAEHFHPYVLNEEHCVKYALAFLKLVRDEMRDHNAEMFSERAAAFDSFQAGAGRIDG